MFFTVHTPVNIILIHKNINFVLLKQKKDSDGQILCLEAMVEGT